MNIFAVNDDPVLAANDLLDRHVTKMCLETAQLLCTVAIKRGFAAVYKPTHQNHPATLWLGKSSANWNWLCLHGIALCEEYTRRYGKIHKCQAYIEDMLARTNEIWGESKPYSEHTPFAQCMPDEYKNTDPVIAYRLYYKGAKSGIATWRAPSSIPEWFACTNTIIDRKF